LGLKFNRITEINNTFTNKNVDTVLNVFKVLIAFIF